MASKNEILSRIAEVKIDFESFTIYLASFLSDVRIKPQPIFAGLWLTIDFSMSFTIFSAYSFNFLVFFFYSSSFILQQQRFLTPLAFLILLMNLSDGKRSSSAICLSQQRNCQNLKKQFLYFLLYSSYSSLSEISNDAFELTSCP